MLYAVIVAGGQGTRLWPASRRNSPKQFRPFAGGETLLQRTYKRVCTIVPPENVLIGTNVEYKSEVLRQLPQFDEKNFVLEPVLRNTAAAVGLSAAVLAKRDPHATMINVWSDHYMKDEAEYRKQVLIAEQVVEQHPDYLLDIVAKPEYPATGFGYLKANGELGRVAGQVVYKSGGFVEKPDLPTATKYLESGDYYWNTAIFVWKVQTLLRMYKRYMPAMYDGLMQIQSAWGTPDQDKVVNEVFPRLEAISVDYAIFEKASTIALMPADFGWRDVGSWHAVHDILSKAEKGVVHKGKVRAIDTYNTLIFNENKDKLVAVVGMKDVVIVDTPDALLVMQKSQDQAVKDVIKAIETSGEMKLL